MIEAIEAVMQHWGEQSRNGCSSGGLASPAGTIMEYGGCAPRGGVAGARMLLAGAGPDYLASEVEAALGAVERGQDGVLLHRLALKRYVNHYGLTLADQVSDLELGVGDAGRRAYFRLLQRLHERVAAELQVRQARSKIRLAEARRAGDKMRKASVKQAARAHAARGVELFKGEKA